MPVVSIVTPTLGRVEYVKRAVASAIAQTFEDFELLILDNSGFDERKRILDITSQDSRIRLIDRGPIGVTEARVLGIQIARGRFVSLLDSDDYWTPNRIERHLSVWKQNAIGLSWDKWAEVYREIVDAYPQPFPEGLVRPPTLARRLYNGNFIHASAGFMETKLAREVRVPKTIMDSDWYIFMRLAEKYPSFFINETLSFKDLETPDSVTNTRPRNLATKEVAGIRRMVLKSRPQIYGWTHIRERILRPIKGRVTSKRYSLHEPTVMNALRTIRGRVFLDVGANRGQYIVALSRNFQQSIAVEPNPLLAKKLERIPNVKVLNIALSDREGETNLYLDTHPCNKNWKLDTIMPEFTYRPGHDARIQEEIRGKHRIAVSTGTVDQIINSEVIDLMKVDVEGAEFLVIKGAAESLSKRLIRRLVIEVHDSRRKQEMEEVMSKYQYSVRWLDADHMLAESHQSMSHL